MSAPGTDREIWPSLPYERWRDTCVTLQLWTQIVGKIRLSFTPWLNHSWHVALYVTARGLTTSPIPFGERAFQIDFDFIDHMLHLEASDGARRKFELRPRIDVRLLCGGDPILGRDGNQDAHRPIS